MQGWLSCVVVVQRYMFILKTYVMYIFNIPPALYLGVYGWCLLDLWRVITLLKGYWTLASPCKHMWTVAHQEKHISRNIYKYMYTKDICGLLGRSKRTVYAVRARWVIATYQRMFYSRARPSKAKNIFCVSSKLHIDKQKL